MSLSMHKKREQVFKLLFRREFHKDAAMEEQERLFFEARPEGEPKLSEKDSEYISGKYHRVAEKIPEIDAMVSERTSGWDISRIGRVELTILRLAIYEMLYDEAVPEGVAINEAVELSKEFGQDNSSSFVNGVLALFAEKKENG
jgi:N utilization substance protein B